MANTPITVAHGDGIGPEIMEASLHIIKEAGARIDYEAIEIGEKVYLRGNTSGIEPSIDLYISWPSLDTAKLATAAQKANGEGLSLTMIDNRGVKVWPEGLTETLLTDAYRCRFTSANGGTTSKKTVALLGRVLEQGLESVKTETLRSYDGSIGYTLSQGQ